MSRNITTPSRRSFHSFWKACVRGWPWGVMGGHSNTPCGGRAAPGFSARLETHMKPGGVAIIDFGSQVTQLIARRVREAHVYCEIFPPSVTPGQLERLAPRGVILSGGPASVYERGATK